MSSDTPDRDAGEEPKGGSRPRTRSRSRTRSRTRDGETGTSASNVRGGDATEPSTGDDGPRRQGRGNQRKASGKGGSGKGSDGKGQGRSKGSQGKGQGKGSDGKGPDGKGQGKGSDGKGGQGAKDGGQKGSGGKGGRSRSRRGRGRRSSEGAGFWGSVEKLPEARDDLRITDDPSAVPRSLGPPPLPGHEVIAEHYFAAVYDRAVTTAGALGAAGGLIDANTLAEELGEE